MLVFATVIKTVRSDIRVDEPLKSWLAARVRRA